MAKSEPAAADKSARYDLKLKQILQQSAEVFAEKGFHNASVRDISRETGSSLAGLYYYFQNKQELLYLILADTFDSVLADLEASLDGYEGADRIRFFIENHLRFFVENLAQMKVASHEVDSLSGRYQESIQEKKRAYFNRLVQILDEEIRASKRQRVDPKMAALALFGMVNWIYTWYDSKKSDRIQEVIDSMSQLFLNGFLPR